MPRPNEHVIDINRYSLPLRIHGHFNSQRNGLNPVQKGLTAASVAAFTLAIWYLADSADRPSSANHGNVIGHVFIAMGLFAGLTAMIMGCTNENSDDGNIELSLEHQFPRP